MRQLLATLRRRPWPLLGTMVAVTLAAMVVVIAASFIGTGATAAVPPDRLAGATVVVTGEQQVSVTLGRGEDAVTERLALPGYRRVPVSLARRLAGVRGVSRVVADLSFPLALDVGHGRVIAGSAAAPVTGHGWPSAVLTPMRLRAGTAPSAPGQIVIGAGLARSAGLHVGSVVHLAGQDVAPLRVSGIAGDGRGDAASDASLFFAPVQAAALYGHPGQADLIGVTGVPGAAPAALAARISAVLASSSGDRYAVATGLARGSAEDLGAAEDKTTLTAIGTGAGIDVVLIALFVLAGTVALSVAQRQHEYALLRAVGATPGQVRRGVLAELVVLGVLGGVLGWLPGQWLASAGMKTLVSNQLMPPSTVAWHAPWLLLIATGTGVIVAVLSGLLASRRAGRARPADALREASADRRWPHPVRILLGLGFLAGAAALAFAAFRTSSSQQLSLALLLLLAAMASVALLGPLLVAAAEFALRGLARAFGVGGRLAFADVRVRPRRMASAVIPVALGVAFAGTIYFLDATLDHAAAVQGRQRLVANEVVTAPGPGLAPAALRAVARQPGVTAAVGLTTAQIVADDPDIDMLSGEIVTPGPLDRVLDLSLASGSLRGFEPGDIAVSQQEAGADEMDVRVGRPVTVHLPDGAPYRARVTAIYRRSLGFGDVVIPAAAAAGHLASASVGQILVRRAGPGTGSSGLTGLAARFPGLAVASRQVVNAQAERNDAQDDLINNLILGVIVLLAAVTVVNTLAMATVERKAALLLLRRVGATPRALLSMAACQSALLTVVGVGLGVVTGAATLTTLSRSLTGGWPQVTLGPALAISGAVLALTLAATLAPTAVYLRGDDNP
jgi:putative ABC transport system permease protein